MGAWDKPVRGATEQRAGHVLLMTVMAPVQPCPSCRAPPALGARSTLQPIEVERQARKRSFQQWRHRSVRIFVSSVRKGLEEERDSFRRLITALGHTPVRFEEFTRNVETYATCVFRGSVIAGMTPRRTVPADALCPNPPKQPNLGEPSCRSARNSSSSVSCPCSPGCSKQPSAPVST
ncbi:DUF4062 domain-containing protein [Streptomyces sp. NPDC054765]